MMSCSDRETLEVSGTVADSSLLRELNVLSCTIGDNKLPKLGKLIDKRVLDWSNALDLSMIRYNHNHRRREIKTSL